MGTNGSGTRRKKPEGWAARLRGAEAPLFHEALGFRKPLRLLVGGVVGVAFQDGEGAVELLEEDDSG
jgi:hypothetical protein